MADENEEEQGQGGEGTGEEEGQGTGENVISREALPPELRDLPEDQIRSTTQALVAALESRNEEIREAREQLRNQGRTAEVEEIEEEEVEELSQDEFKDLILEDPDAALEHWLAKKGYAKRLQQIENMATEGARSGAFSQIRQEFSDFDRHEERAREILDTTGAAPTYANLRGAYMMARGEASLVEENKKKGETVKSEPPSKPEEKQDKVELTPDEDRARRALGLSVEDYTKHKGQSRTEVTPPGLE